MWFNEKPEPKRKSKRPAARRATRSPIVKVKARGAERQRTRQHRIRVLTVLLTALAGCVILLVAGTRALGRVLYSENDQYIIQRVEVHNPGGKLNKRLVAEYANVRPGSNLFAVDLRQVLHELESTPLIKGVTLRRKLPDTLQINIVERTALASLESMWAVDVEGYVLGPSARSPHLPTITGLRMLGLRPGSHVQEPSLQLTLQLLDIVESSQVSRHLRIVRIDCSDPESLDVHLAGGERVVLGRDQLPTRLNKLVQVLARAKENGRRLEVIDLTGDHNVPVIERPSA